MMRQSKLSLYRHKVLSFFSIARKLYYRSLGLKIGKNVELGKITCLWPGSVQIGSNSVIEDNVDFKISHPFRDTDSIIIGHRVFIGRSCEFNCTDRIVIGDDCMIASNTTLVDVGHEFSNQIPINRQAIVSKEIIIGEGVWIGTGCRILKGVNIGSGSIIAAGSVVNKGIPKNQIWAGVPAKFIKNRF